MDTKPKNKGGRPNVYDTKIKPYLKQIHTLRRQGYTHDDIYPMLNIAKSSYFKHKREIEEFSHSINNADAELIAQLENSLYDLALGRAKKTIEVERDIWDDKQDKFIRKNVETRVETLPPNNTSLIFALSNLKNDKWKQRQDITYELSDDDEDTFEEAVKKGMANATNI